MSDSPGKNLLASRPLPILALGMVTPHGPDALRTVAFSDSGVAAPAPVPYARSESETSGPGELVPVELSYCAWWPVPEARGPAGSGPLVTENPAASQLNIERKALADRLRLMALSAIREALANLLPEEQRSELRAMDVCPAEARSLPLHVCLPAPHGAIAEEELAQVAKALSQYLKSSKTILHCGEASVFEAFRMVGASIDRRDASRAIVVAVDSSISLLAVDEVIQHPVSDWEPLPPRPSEAAAAFLVGMPVGVLQCPIAILQASGAAPGAATDDDDLPPDAIAMAGLLRSLPPCAPIGTVFGQDQLDLLRLRDWEFAASRERERFAVEIKSYCVESILGRLGAAAGAVSLAYAITATRFGFIEQSSDATVCVWAISPDGLRGMALFSLPKEGRSS